ncbi:hypothetical protein GM921_03510 [Pedobacter sp. LMG 31464]|uniref:Lipoprotein n=1 Tax=Pedobacter planticolens TaxID=2679964 RepID=A0A923IUV0_9SPHI|nr:hypothetical protein [Pedobacter planticolens]MBB2144539.1 hypothetical protein [Pedobacter planticolens]
MKNLFKFGFLAFAIATSLTACGLFGSDPKTPVIDSTKIDTSKIDTSSVDSKMLDSNKINVDSTKIKH